MKKFLKEVFMPKFNKLVKINLIIITIGIIILSLFLLTSCGTQGRCDGIYHPAMQDRN